jgi:hypothetical protein
MVERIISWHKYLKDELKMKLRIGSAMTLIEVK